MSVKISGNPWLIYSVQSIRKLSPSLNPVKNSRKVRHIHHDSRVALYYFDSYGPGYVSITGSARLVKDPKEKALRWKKE
ncbi:MAG: hypothetical protein E2O77_02845 [Caldithrix sp.]|nr:MAG: hypothetical protein E2O77_02845 [Caldithrix sp.]